MPAYFEHSLAVFEGEMKFLAFLFLFGCDTASLRRAKQTFIEVRRRDRKM